MGNQLTRTARELLQIENDLPCRLDYTEMPRSSIDDFELYTFMQTWASTALGFGGIGGQAITAARTYVLVPMNCNQKCFVYFAGRFAYAVPFSDIIYEDIRAANMEPVSRAGKYVKAAKMRFCMKEHKVYDRHMSAVKFCEKYLGVKLRWYQKILLSTMEGGRRRKHSELQTRTTGAWKIWKRLE